MANVRCSHGSGREETRFFCCFARSESALARVVLVYAWSLLAVYWPPLRYGGHMRILFMLLDRKAKGSSTHNTAKVVCARTTTAIVSSLEP